MLAAVDPLPNTSTRPGLNPHLRPVLPGIFADGGSTGLRRITLSPTPQSNCFQTTGPRPQALHPPAPSTGPGSPPLPGRGLHHLVPALQSDGGDNSTVTELAKWRGWPTSLPRPVASSQTKICSGTVATSGWSRARVTGTQMRWSAADEVVGVQCTAGSYAPADTPFPFDPDLCAAVRPRLAAEALKRPKGCKNCGCSTTDAHNDTARLAHRLRRKESTDAAESVHEVGGGGGRAGGAVTHPGAGRIGVRAVSTLRRTVDGGDVHWPHPNGSTVSSSACRPHPPAEGRKAGQGEHCRGTVGGRPAAVSLGRPSERAPSPDALVGTPGESGG